MLHLGGGGRGVQQKEFHFVFFFIHPRIFLPNFFFFLCLCLCMPVIAGLYTSSQFSNALHLHGGNLLFKSHILSGRQRCEFFGKSYLNCATVVQLGKDVSPASGSHFGWQPKISVMLLLTQA